MMAWRSQEGAQKTFLAHHQRKSLIPDRVADAAMGEENDDRDLAEHQKKGSCRDNVGHLQCELKKEQDLSKLSSPKTRKMKRMMRKAERQG